MELTAGFFYGVFQIILADLILAGDNALLIGIVTQTLPSRIRLKACLLGTAGAMVCRIVFGMLAISLFEYRMIKIVGGILIVLIATKLVAPQGEAKEHKASNTLCQAAWTIISADVVMSGDNVLAVAGVAHGNFALFAFGIAFSLPLMVFASQGVVWVLDRWPKLSLFGGIFLGWAGGVLIAEDSILSGLHGLKHIPLQNILGITAMLTVFLWYQWKNKKTKEIAQ